MKELINSVKEFKIIPDNFKSSGTFKVLDVNDNVIVAKLNLSDDTEYSDYSVDSGVEVFGVNDVGLVYFVTKITKADNDVIELATTRDYSIIQRREYSRVGIKQGTIIFNDMSEDFVLNVEDISAGGAKLITKSALDNDKLYDISILLSVNMKINCKLKTIRSQETKYNNKKAYVVSGKFVDLDNVDRIVLVQYAFKIKMEEQNRENG